MNASYLSDNNSVNNTFIKTNIKDKYNGTKKMQELLNKGSQDNKTVLLFVDNKNNIWELIRRSDIKLSQLNNPDSISSIIKTTKNNSCFNTEKLLNIEINDNNSENLNTVSDVNISRNSNFDLSTILREDQKDHK